MTNGLPASGASGITVGFSIAITFDVVNLANANLTISTLSTAFNASGAVYIGFRVRIVS